MDTNTLLECKRIFEDGMISLFATPKAMELDPKYSSFSSLKAMILEEWESIVMSINNRNESLGVARYVSGSWMPYIPRKKGKAKSAALSAAMRLANIEPSRQEIILGKGFRQTGFTMVNWHMFTGTLEVQHIGIRMMALTSVGLGKDMLKSVISRIMMDSLAEGQVPIKHVWIALSRDNFHLGTFIERLGFVSLSHYVKRNPTVDPDLFLTSHQRNMKAEDSDLFVSSVDAILSEDKTKQKKSVLLKVKR